MPNRSNNNTSDSQSEINQLSIIWPKQQRGLDTTPEWIVEGILRRGCTCCLYGLPGTYKSYLASDLAICVANEIPEFLALPIRCHGPVLVIAADDGAHLTVDRLR